jgi:hypothetical protein
LDAGGAFSPLDDPSGTQTYAEGINNAGDVVGAFLKPPVQSHYGFCYQNPRCPGATSPWLTVDDPAAGHDNPAHGTVLTAINDTGKVVGYFVDASSNVHVFVDTLTV